MQLIEIVKVIEMKRSNDQQRRVIKEALDIFNSSFDHNIRDLKRMFPDDHVNQDGQKFWSGPKRCPQPVVFDANDRTCLEFVWTCANLILTSLSEQTMDIEAVGNIAREMPMVQYVPKTIHVETPEEEKAREAEGRPPPRQNENLKDDEPIISSHLQSLSESTQGLTTDCLNAAEFEKDDDSNFHIDFINSCSNLRARNYKITESDRN